MNFAMRAYIQHEERTAGLLRSIRQVDVVVHVEFSDEERVIIERRGLEEFVILERTPDTRLLDKLRSEEINGWDHSFHLRVRDLLGATPDRFTFDTPSDAKAYQARLTDALRSLKAFILANTTLGEATTLEI